MEFRTIIEPFRIKSIETIKTTTPEERRKAISAAGYNVFLLHAVDVLIDLLTDSGMGAMSSAQWGALMQGDESYAGSRSFYRFRDVVKDLTGFAHIIPTHQGRAAERILFHTILEKDGDRIPVVMVTVTNNSGGGQPVSLENLRGVRGLCDRFKKPFFLDACRFAENAYLVKRREKGQEGRTPKEIAQEMFSLADGCTMSAKKDGLANIGGFLAMNDDAWAEEARNLLILTEGFPTYGGLAGYDLEAIARGLEEVVEEPYLHYRIRSIEYLAEKLEAAGVPMIRPPGGHAVYLDARALLPLIPPLQYPGIALVNALYEVAGVRGVEIGTVMFGMHPDGSEHPGPMDLVRLAFPRRVYTQSHVDYVAEAVLEVARNAATLPGYRITEAPRTLRHFTARFEPLAS